MENHSIEKQPVEEPAVDLPLPPRPQGNTTADVVADASAEKHKSNGGRQSAHIAGDCAAAAERDMGRTERIDCVDDGAAGVSETVEAPGGRRSSDGGGSNSHPAGEPSQPTASSTAPEQQQDTASTEAPAPPKERAFHPPSSSVARNRKSAAAPDLKDLPILPEVVRYREGKKDVPMLCLVQGCGVDLSAQAEYYQRYRVCKEHLKFPALLVDGVPQRFCQQCGRFHELAEFDGEKRNCRARLEQHNSRRRKVFVTNQGAKRRTGKERGAQKQAYQDGDMLDEMGEDNHAFLEDVPRRSVGRRSKQSSVPQRGLRRGRSVFEGSDLMLTPEEKEAILLLRHAEEHMEPPPDLMAAQQEQQGGRGAKLADMPRFLSEPVRGTHTWRNQAEKGADAEIMGLLPPHVQELLGRWQQQSQPPSRQPSLPNPFVVPQPLAQPGQLSTDLLHGVGAGLAGKGGGVTLGRRGGSAFTAVGSQPLRGGAPANWAEVGGLLPTQYSGGAYPRTVQEERHPSLKARMPGAGPADMEGGGVFRSQTEPVGRRAGPQDPSQHKAQPPSMRSHAANPQLLAATVPRDGFTHSRPQDMADLLRSLDAANNPTPAQAPQQGQVNPFAPQRAPAAWPSKQPARPTNALPPQGAMPKASVLLRQMADLAASAEQAMEQMALQQKSGQVSFLDAFPTPFQGPRQQQGGGGGFGRGGGLLGGLGALSGGLDPGASNPLPASHSSGLSTLSTGGGLSSAELMAVLSSLEQLPSAQKGQLLEAMALHAGGMEGGGGGRGGGGEEGLPATLGALNRRGGVQPQEPSWKGDRGSPSVARGGAVPPHHLPRMPSGRGAEGQGQRAEQLLASLLAGAGQRGLGAQGSGGGGELSAVQELMSLLQQGGRATPLPVQMQSSPVGNNLS